MLRLTKRWSWAVCLILLATASVQAADEVLKLVPDSALGLAIINGPAAIDTKVQNVGAQLQLPVPGLLEQLKQGTGIGDGVDMKGSLALLVLNSPEAGGMPGAVVLVPVTDYAKFVQTLNPKETTGEVSKVEIANNEVLVRKIGGFAALTDAPHAKLLETVKVGSTISAELDPIKTWLTKNNDVAVVLLEPGVKMLTAQAQAGIQMMKLTMGQGNDQAKMAAAAFGMYEKLFQAVSQEVTAFGVGLQLNDQGTLRVTSRTRLTADGEWAKAIAGFKPSSENLLTGLPAGPFVVAGGGAVPPGVWDTMMKASIGMMKSMPEVYGLTADKADKLPDLSFPELKQVHSMSMEMGVGAADAPLYSALAAIMRVDDTATFLAGYEKSMQKYSAVLKDLSSPMLPAMTFEKCEVGGLSGLQITMKTPMPPNAAALPQMQEVMDKMFGPGGKVQAWLIAVDEHTIAVGYTDKKLLEQMIQGLKKGETGLAADANIAKTAALLPSGAPGVAYWSPKGTVEFVRRTVQMLAPPNVQADIKIPEFPATPPIGFAFATRPNELLTVMVVPMDVTKAIVQFAGQVQATFNARPMPPPVQVDPPIKVDLQ